MSAFAYALDAPAATRAARWIYYAAHDLDAYAADIQPRAAWVALEASGWPMGHPSTAGCRAYTPVFFSSAEGASEHGRPVCVDLLWGKIVRAWMDPAELVVVVVGASEISESRRASGRLTCSTPEACDEPHQMSRTMTPEVCA